MTSPPHVVLWAVADDARGAGHYVRMCALADALESRGARVDLAITGGMPRFGARKPTHTGSVAEVAPHIARAHVVVADLRDVPAPELDGRRGLVWVTDDLAAPRPRLADIIVYPNLVIPPGTDATVLAGAPHLLLRPEFGALPARVQRPGLPRALLTAFGGTDPDGLAPRALDALAEVAQHPWDVTILSPRAPALPSRSMPPGGRIEHHAAVGDVAARMARADVALIAGGTMLYEACAAGLPALVVSRNPGEAREAATLAREGCAIHLGSGADALRAATLRDALAQLASPGARAEMAARARARVDGAGCDRVADAILALARRLASADHS